MSPAAWTAFLRFWTLNLLQNQMCLCFVSFPEAFCCHGDLHSALPVWSVVQSCLSLPGPSLPVPKQKLCSCCTGTCDCCTDLFLVIIPSHVSLSPSKLWHWLNKQVMTLRSPVLTERLTDHESVWFERNKVKLKEKRHCLLYRVWEKCKNTPLSLDWRFIHSRHQPSLLSACTSAPVLLLFCFVFPLLFSPGSYSCGTLDRVVPQPCVYLPCFDPNGRIDLWVRERESVCVSVCAAQWGDGHGQSRVS